MDWRSRQALLRNDESSLKRRRAATKQSSWIATARRAPRDDKAGFENTP
jgi:hypothetical protein